MQFTTLHQTIIITLILWIAPNFGFASTATPPQQSDAYTKVTPIFNSEIARFTKLAATSIPALQIEAAQGFYYLKHKSGESIILPLLNSSDSSVRLQAVKSLSVCGGQNSIAPLIQSLNDNNWEIGAAAIDALHRMTAQTFPPDFQAWQNWLNASDWPTKEAALIKQLTSKDQPRALAALQALVHVGTPASEEAVVKSGATVGFAAGKLIAKALERVGTQKSLPLLLQLAPKSTDLFWPLLQIAPDDAQSHQAVHTAFNRSPSHPPFMLNFDRIHGKPDISQIATLLKAFGLIIYRTTPDDLHRPPSSTQRLAANLILRSGQSQKVVDLILAQIEGTRRDQDTPLPLQPLLANMAEELLPGFQRNDGVSVAMPLASLGHITRDPAFTPRLIKLLDHPNFVVRIYVAEALAALHAQEAVPHILRVINTPYPFSDSTTLTSGKHKTKSQTVRWRGYLAIALGKLGGEKARLALQQLATNPTTYRDIRFGATAGLAFLASPKSLPTLKTIAQNDIILEIQRTARNAAHEIKLAQQLNHSNPAQ